MTTAGTERPPSHEGAHRGRGLGGILGRLGHWWQGLLGIEPLWIFVFVAIGLWVLVPPRARFTPTVQAGDIAVKAYVASKDLRYEDLATTREKQQTARDEVLPVYDFEPTIEREVGNSLLQLFEVGRVIELAVEDGYQPASSDAADDSGDSETSALDELLVASQLKVTPEQLDVLVAQQFSVALEDRLRSTLTQLLRRGVVGDKSTLLANRDRGITLRNLETGVESVEVDLYRRVGYPHEAEEYIDTESRRWTDLDRQQRNLMSGLLRANVVPNLQLNRSETRARREAAAHGTAGVFREIRAGQVIVRSGDQIDETAARLINGNQGERRLAEVAFPAFGKLLLLSLGALVLWLVLKGESSLVDSRQRVFGGLLLILAAGLPVLRFLFLITEALGESFESGPFNQSELYVFAIPFASIGLITHLLYGRNLALLISVVFAFIAGQFTDNGSLGIVMYSLGGSLAAVHFGGQIKKRSGVILTGLVAGGINVVATLMILALDGDRLSDLKVTALSLLCAFVGGLLVAAVTSFAVPVLEWVLSLTTDMTLVELSNTNLPLLRRLAFEAPGTFQHSLMVANLAKAGCAEIGSNAILAYTGALYHDIGKLMRPEYFIENQRGGHNPHDDLEPSTSARVIVNHVTEGLEMASENRLPRVVQAAIAQHHGTHLLTYFYRRAQDQQGDDVDESIYRYPGPRPQTRAMGVLMLADAVEAASRTLVDATPQQIHTLVSSIFESHVQDSQLDETKLTLADLRRVGEEFERILATLHHRRVDYPGFDFDAPTDRHLRAVGES